MSVDNEHQRAVKYWDFVLVARWWSLSTETGVYPTEISLNLYILRDLGLTIWHSLRGEKLAATVWMEVEGSI
jgi:hypothetical protein